MAVQDKLQERPKAHAPTLAPAAAPVNKRKAKMFGAKESDDVDVNSVVTCTILIKDNQIHMLFISRCTLLIHLK